MEAKTMAGKWLTACSAIMAAIALCGGIAFAQEKEKIPSAPNKAVTPAKERMPTLARPPEMVTEAEVDLRLGRVHFFRNTVHVELRREGPGVIRFPPTGSCGSPRK